MIANLSTVNTAAYTVTFIGLRREKKQKETAKKEVEEKMEVAAAWCLFVFLLQKPSLWGWLFCCEVMFEENAFYVLEKSLEMTAYCRCKGCKFVFSASLCIHSSTCCTTNFSTLPHVVIASPLFTKPNVLYLLVLSIPDKGIDNS